MNLKGDYFNNAFHAVLKADEVISKKAPSDLSKHLWDAHVSHAHIEAVIQSAEKGFQAWRLLSLEKRVEYLRKYQQKVKEKKNLFTEALAWEVGKPLWEAATEAGSIDSKVDVTVTDSLKRIEKKTLTEVMPKIDGHTISKPLGPSLVIGPFNFPCHLANGQILSSLLAGNSVIFKPSEKTIYSAQLMIECFHEAGFPEGVVNFINGSGVTASKLTGDKRIRAVFFTGSKAVGLKILENTHKDLGKMVALELGGKNSTIVHSDAHIPHALPELLRACYLTSGQRCTSTALIFIHRKLEQEFIAHFKKVTENIIVDHPVLAKIPPFMGTVIDAQAEKLYFDFCAQGKKEGADELIPATKLSPNGFKGHYCSPSLHYFSKPNIQGKFFQDEIFGPNCCFIPYDNIEDAIKMANATEYGLAASVYTRDKSIYELCVRDIDAGLINLNRSTVGATARLPFGGVKSSGNFHPAAVSMIDHCVSIVASLETLDDTSSKLSDVIGLKD